MTGSYEHELMDEVRDARRAVARARIAEADARTAYREAQAERMTKERALEEVLDAIATGDTGHALFDRAARDREAREAEADAREAARDVVAAEPPTIQVVEDAWTRTPLKAVVKGADLVALLKGNGLLTLGDLFDACELCGCLADAIEDLGPTHVAAIDHDVRAWVAKHPGFPLDRLARPEPPRSELIDDELHAALYPAGFDPGWLKCRSRGGLSNVEAARKLADLWPGRADFRSDTEDGPGHTVRGGDKPAFWLGELKPGTNPPADLEGPDLYDAIRRVLELPKLSADDVDPMEAARVREELGEAAPGPDRVEGAVGLALCQLRSELVDKLRKGATDAQIAEVLTNLPTGRREPRSGHAWATAGGLDFAVWFAEDAAAWPDRRHATVKGDRLVAMVRKVAKIPQPKVKKAAQPKKSEAVR